MVVKGFFVTKSKVLIFVSLFFAADIQHGNIDKANRVFVTLIIGKPTAV